MALPPFEIGKSALDLLRGLSVTTLTTVSNALGASMRWGGEQLSQVGAVGLVEDTKIGEGIRKTGEALSGAGNVTAEKLAAAVHSTSGFFEKVMGGLGFADDSTRRTLFENIALSSVVGSSFDSVLPSDIKLSFRLPGEDISVDRASSLLKASGLKSVAVLVPGLFTDEMLFYKNEPFALADVMRECGIFPLALRFHPGLHISQNGDGLSALLEDFAGRAAGVKIHAITYSQGGLILRSALYDAVQKKRKWKGRLGRITLVSSPDGGSYIEKVGFLAGAAFESAPLLSVRLAGMIGNMRSDAMKDLSHGIIRQEDWDVQYFQRYGRDLYFGELDDVDAYQIFSLVGEKDNAVASWFGDGVVEKPSLIYLTERVYQKKTNPEKRVIALHGYSHFTVLQAPELKPALQTIYK